MDVEMYGPSLAGKMIELQKRIELREKQLADCTRTMLTVATRLQSLPLEVSVRNEEIVGPIIAGCAQDLLNVCAGKEVKP